MFFLFKNDLRYIFNFNTKKEALVFLLDELDRNDVNEPNTLIKKSKKEKGKFYEKVFLDKSNIYTFKYIEGNVFTNYEKCNICYNSMLKTYNLSCGHSVCNDCIDKIRNFNCPMCRKEIKGKIITDEIYAKILQNQENDNYEEEMENYRAANDIHLRLDILDIMDIIETME